VGRQFLVPALHSRTELLLDVDNPLNLGGNQGFLFGAHQMFSPNFKQGTSQQFARSVQLSVRTSF
jgi:hypothetical protein